MLVVLVETMLSFLPDNAVVQRFHASHIPPESPDWLVMGDSVAAGGIIASELSDCLDHQYVFNAAIPATGPAFSYFILQRDLAAGRMPKAIIYAPSPHTFASQSLTLLVGGYCHWKEIGEILGTGIKIPETAYGILCKVSYSLRNREQISSLFKNKVAHDVQEEYAGDTPLPMRPANRHYALNDVLPILKKPFTVRSFNRLMLGKFLALARQNHIRVYWVTMPVLSVVHEGREPYDFDRDYQTFLAGLQKQYGIIVVQKDFPILDDQSFSDSLHLSPPAAIKFTQYLGTKLASFK